MRHGFVNTYFQILYFVLTYSRCSCIVLTEQKSVPGRGAPQSESGSKSGQSPAGNQIPRCKQRSINLAALQSRKRPSDTLVFDPRGIRQTCMQACPLDLLLAGIKTPRRRKALSAKPVPSRLRSQSPAASGTENLTGAAPDSTHKAATAGIHIHTEVSHDI